MAEAKMYFVSFLKNQLNVVNHPDFAPVLEMDLEKMEKEKRGRGFILFLVLMLVMVALIKSSGADWKTAIGTSLFGVLVIAGSGKVAKTLWYKLPKIIEKLSYQIGMPSEVWWNAPVFPDVLSIKPLFKKDKRFSKMAFLRGVEFLSYIFAIILMMTWLALIYFSFSYLVYPQEFMEEFRDYFG